MTPTMRKCPGCAMEIPPDMAGGSCPKCLLSIGLDCLEDADLPSTDFTPLLSEPRQPLGVKFHSIGDYELLEEIARGGMGVVFRARQVSLNRTVALKIIQARWMTSREAVKRFRFEAEAAAGMAHPNIVPIYEVGEQDGHNFFSMKFVEGGSLATRLSEAQALGSTRVIAELMMKVARAIHFAHQHGIVHRDLKPGNILLDGKGEPHVTDFGVALALETGNGLTHAGEILGTPAYMSPEQAADHGKITTAADLYSLGAILYELLTGRAPFWGNTALETVYRLLNEQPKPPRDFNPTVARDLETICLRCLEKEPTQRYPSADALAQDLENFLNDRPVMARPIGTAERVFKWMRRQPILATAVSACVFTGIAGFTGILWQWRNAEQERVRANAAYQSASGALRQMEAVQVGRAEEQLESGNPLQAMPHWALVLRENPEHRLAAERLFSTLAHRHWARLAVPPLTHSNRITFATLNHDGTRILTSSADHTAWIWDAATGARATGPLRHPAEINRATFSRDGELVLTLSRDAASVWEARSGRPVCDPIPHAGDVRLGCFSPDAQMIATAIKADRKVSLWASHTGELLSTPLEHPAAVRALEFSPDGTRLAVAFGETVRVWDIASRKVLVDLPHEDSSQFGHFSPDGRRLLTGADDGVAAVWEIPQGQRIAAFRHRAGVNTGAFSPEGSRVLTASDDRTAQIWDAKTGRELAPALVHAERVRFAVFSADGLMVLTSASDRTTRLWNALNGEPLAEPIAEYANANYGEFFPDGTRILTASSSDQALVWDIRGVDAVILPPAAPATKGEGASVKSPIETFLGGSPRTWNVARGVLGPRAYEPRERPFYYSPDGSLMIARLRAGAYRILRVASGEPLSVIEHDAPVRDIAFSREGQWILSSSDDETARVWNSQTGAAAGEPLVHNGAVTCGQFGPNNDTIATASTDGFARIWNRKTMRLAAVPLEHGGAVRWIAYAPDGSRLATAAEKIVRIWDTRNASRPPDLLTHGYPIEFIKFSPNGQRLVALGSSRVFLWSVPEGRLLAQEIRSILAPNALDFSADSKRLLVAQAENVAQILSADTGERLSERFLHLKPVLSAGFSSDDRFVQTTSVDGLITLRETRSLKLPVPEWLPRLAEAVAGHRFNARGVLQQVPPEELWQVNSALLELPDTDAFSHWGKWFATRGSRALSPSVPITERRYAEILSQSEALPGLQARLAPTDERIQQRFAEQLVFESTDKNPSALYQAQAFARRLSGRSGANTLDEWVNARVQDKLGNLPGVIASMEKAAAANPKAPEFWIEKGRLFLTTHRFAEAREDFTRAIDSATNYVPRAQAMRREALRLRAEASKGLGFFAEAAADNLAAHNLAGRAPGLDAHLIDLSAAYDAGLHEPLAVVDNDMAEIPSGVHRFAGVRFDIRGVVRLAGAASIKRGIELPQRVAGIPIDQQCLGLHFLHGMQWEGPPDLEIGRYIVRFQDGVKIDVPIVVGQNVLHWGRRRYETTKLPSDSVVAFTGTNPALKEADNLLQVIKFYWKNPRPDVPVGQLDFVSSLADPSPFLLGITAESPEPPEAFLCPATIELSPWYTLSISDLGLAPSLWRADSGQIFGEVRFNDVAFDVRGAIRLECESTPRNQYPAQVSEIPINRSVHNLHFLHSAEPGAALRENERIGAYVIHYQDGSRAEVPIVYAQNVRSFHTRHDAVEETPNATPVPFPARRARLYHFKWRNPRPESMMVSLDFLSEKRAAAPMLLALTAE